MTARGGEYWSTGPGGGEQPDEWQAMISATHLPWTVRIAEPDDDRPFTAWIRRWWIDDLALVDCECSPCSGTRQRRHVAGTDGEFVVVLITRAGQESVSQGDREAVLRAGDTVVWDSTAPARFTVWEPLAKRSLLVPRAALDEVDGRAWTGPGVTLNGAAPATRLLVTYLDTLAATLPELPASAVVAARNATLELLAGAFRVQGDVPTTSTGTPALRAAMDRYIDSHLLHGSVSPSGIAAAHGVSVRTVNRIFTAGGRTVGEVVRLRRLARAREELTDSDRTVSAIAHRWGFSDPSHFTRSFKAAYGLSPRAYRLAAREAGGAPVQADGADVHVRSPRPSQTRATAARS
jgi:AraC family transcriptional regulator, positive regulator of tynA and feaB